MNVVTKALLAVVDTILVAIHVPFIISDPSLIPWYLLCVMLGFVLRLGMERRKRLLTWETAMWHSICTIGWCFLAAIVWWEMGYSKWFSAYLFLNSLFAAFLVTQLDEIGKQGIREWFRIKLGKFLATEKAKEDQP